MLRDGLIIGGGALEAAALGAIAAGQGPAWALLALHAVAAVLLGTGLVARLRPALRRRPGGLLCFIGLALCLPGVGAVGLLAVVASLGRRGRGAPPRAQVVPPPTLPPRPPESALGPAADALRGIIWHAPDPARRAEALLRAARIGGAGGVSLLRAGLRDPSDDVRLLAHALLSRWEHAGLRRAQTLEQQIAEAPLAARPGLRRQLVHVLCDLVEVHILEDDACASALRSARQHAEALLAEAGEDPGMLILLGRILLRQGEVAGAERALLRARSLGANEACVQPLLADAAFRARRLAQARAAGEVACDVPRRAGARAGGSALLPSVAAAPAGTADLGGAS